MIPLGSLAGGVLADALGVRWVFAVAGGVLLALALALRLLLGRHQDVIAIEARSEFADAEQVTATA